MGFLFLSLVWDEWQSKSTEGTEESERDVICLPLLTEGNPPEAAGCSMCCFKCPYFLHPFWFFNYRWSSAAISSPSPASSIFQLHHPPSYFTTRNKRSTTAKRTAGMWWRWTRRRALPIQWEIQFELPAADSRNIRLEIAEIDGDQQKDSAMENRKNWVGKQIKRKLTKDQKNHNQSDGTNKGMRVVCRSLREFDILFPIQPPFHLMPLNHWCSHSAL